NMGVAGEEEDPPAGGGDAGPASKKKKKPEKPKPWASGPEPEDEDLEEESAGRERLEAAERRMLLDILRRAGKRIATQARRRAKLSPQDLCAWVEEGVEKENRSVIEDMAGPALE